MLDIDGRRSRFANDLSDSSKGIFFVTFNGFENYEASIGKYIEDMDDDEFSEAMRQTMRKSSRTNSQKISIISRYFTWCKQNGYNFRSPEELRSFEGREEATISAVKKTMFASPAHLQSFLDKVFDPVEIGSADCLYRCFIWLVYMGLSIEEIESVQVDNIDLFRFTIRFGSVEYKLPSESLAVIHACMTLDSFRVESQHVLSGIYYVSRSEGKHLLRRAAKSNGVSYFRMRTDTAKKVHSKGYAVELDGVRKSGSFYRIFQREQITGEADFSMLIIRSIESDPKFSEKRKDLQEKTVRTLRNYIRKDYEAWKSAFNMK